MASTRGVQQGDVLGPALFAIAPTQPLRASRVFHFSLDQGTVVLGVPIGSAAFVENFVSDICTKLSYMAERIGLLKSNIAKFLLLRACFGACRVNHLLRSLPFQHGKSLAEKASAIVRSTLEAIVGSPLPDICFMLACLPSRKGGLGLQDPALVFGLASNFGFACCHGGLPDKFWRELTDAWSIVREKLHLNATTLASLEVLDSVETDDVDPAFAQVVAQQWIALEITCSAATSWASMLATTKSGTNWRAFVAS